jgi:succinyl-diaminopimelate desuccinylase
MQRVTVNLGKIEGGTSSNLVPSKATAGLDIRIPLGLSADDVQGAAAGLLNRHPTVTWTTERFYEPSWTDAASPVAQACLSAVGDVRDAQAWFDMRIGGSDARLWRRAGFETVVLGLTPYNLGAPDEYLMTEELGPLTAIYCVAAQRFLYD